MIRPKNERITLTIVFVIFVLYAITLVYPFITMFLNSFKVAGDFAVDIWGIPLKPTIENYAFLNTDGRKRVFWGCF